MREVISGERFDEICKLNNVTADKIRSFCDIDNLCDVFDFDTPYSYGEDDYGGGVDIEDEEAFETFVENVFYNGISDFLRTLKRGVTKKERGQLEDGDIEVEKSKIFDEAFYDWYTPAKEDAEERLRDPAEYEKDPYSCYGVSHRDFF